VGDGEGDNLDPGQSGMIDPGYAEGREAYPKSTPNKVQRSAGAYRPVRYPASGYNLDAGGWAERMAPATPVSPVVNKKGVLPPEERERQRIVSWLTAGSPMGQTNKDIEAYNLMKGKVGTVSVNGAPANEKDSNLEKAAWLRRYQEALISSMADKSTAAKVTADARSVAANTLAAKTGASAASKKKDVVPAVTPLGESEEQEKPGYFSNYGEKARTVGDWLGGLFGKSSPKPLTANDQAAIAWANKNPKDARAIAIKKRLGVK
jgi:hypothetical protein